MATIAKRVRLKHRGNLGEEPQEIVFEEGEEITILNTWEDRYLCRNSDGLLFNIPKEFVQPD